MRQLLMVGILIIVPVPSWAGQSMNVSMVSANSIDKELPFKALTEGTWQPEAGAEYVKIHIFPDKETVLSGFEVESCKKPLKTFYAYVNFDEAVLLSGEGDPAMYFAYYDDPKRLQTVESQYFASPIRVRSITFNFDKNELICIKRISLFDEMKEKVTIKVPRITEGSAVASSTLDPVMSYDVMNLFDSRFEYAWASNKQATGVNIKFSFSNEETIEKIMIWNGYQRSDVHCQANSRVKTMQLEGDNGYKATVTVADQMGPQIIDLPTPYKGRLLTLSVTEAYVGKKYQDLVISELRFFDGKQWFMLNPVTRLRAISEHNRKAFAKANIENVLNRGLRHKEYAVWELRLRADGSVYIRGIEYVNRSDVNTLYVTGLGNYEILASDKEKGLKLRIFGFLREALKLEEMDCNGCGRDCNTSKTDPKVKERIFQQFVTLKRINDDSVQLFNDSPAKKLKFDELTLARD